MTALVEGGIVLDPATFDAEEGPDLFVELADRLAGLGLELVHFEVGGEVVDARELSAT